MMSASEREQSTRAEMSSQERVVGHGDGPLLLVGEAGTGKSEALARRLARLAASGTEPEQVLVLASTPATAQRLRERAESLLGDAYGELWIGTWETLGEHLLREHATAAGLDPFFDVLGPAERLAMLLDRLEDLPLRHHDIRGNPAGLLATLLEQIDELKASSEPADPELAELVAAHDRILAAAGSLDRGDVFLTLNRLLEDRPDVRQAIATRFAHVMVDELEDTTPAQRAILAALAAEHANHLYALEEQAVDPDASDLRTWSLAIHPEAEVVQLESRFRDPPVRFWRCANERAQAQAVAIRGRSASSSTTPASAAERLPQRWRSAASHSSSPAPPPSSSGPRCATRSPGCGCSPTRPTRQPRRGR
jgi:DNA helicase-2/ATP-dependent DNA helicase PcrA